MQPKKIARKVVYVPLSYLAEVLRDGLNAIEIQDGLPADADIVHVFHDTHRNSVGLVVRSETYSPEWEHGHAYSEEGIRMKRIPDHVFCLLQGCAYDE